MIVSTMLNQRIREYGYIIVPATGFSMYPFIRQGDQCRFQRMAISQVSIGDVILFTVGERLIAHRLQRRELRSESPAIWCKGDVNLLADPPIKWTEVIGVLTSIERAGAPVKLDTWWVWCWGQVALRFPMYSRWMRGYVTVVRKRGRMAHEEGMVK